MYLCVCVFYFTFVTQYMWVRCSASFSFSENQAGGSSTILKLSGFHLEPISPQRVFGNSIIYHYCHNWREWCWKLMGRDAIKHSTIHRTHPTSDTQNYLVQNDHSIKVEKPHCICTISTFSDPMTWKKTDGSSALYPENNTHHFYPQHSCPK